MAAFVTLDWLRLDVMAIVGFRGIASVTPERHEAARRWLAREGYGFETFDCRLGLSTALPALGKRLRWEEQFGYALTPTSRNLDALRDGFEFDVPDNGGLVFEVVRPDLGSQEDERWLRGLLAIAQEHSLTHLALGRRFFTLLVLPGNSSFIGTETDQLVVPAPFLFAAGQKSDPPE